MKRFFSSISIFLVSLSLFAQTADSLLQNPKLAQKELTKNIKMARVYATDPAKPDFKAARKEIAAALANPQLKTNEADVYLAAGDVEFNCFNVERNKPAKGGKIDDDVIYDSSLNAYIYYNKAYEIYSAPDANMKVNAKNKTAIQKKAWTLFTATGGFRVNASYAYEKQQWKKSHDCFDLFIKALDSQMVKDLTSSNARARQELAMLNTDSIVAHAKYFRACNSVLLEDTQTAIDELKDMKYLGYEQNYVFQELCRQYNSIGENVLYENTLIEGIKLFPKEPWYAQNLMNIYLDNKDFDAAAIIIDNLLLADPENPSSLSLKGTLVELQGNVDLALAYLEKAYSLDPDNADINSNLGRIWYNKAQSIETEYFDKRQYDRADEESMPLYIKAAEYYVKAFKADTTHCDITIANGIRNVRYKQFTKVDCPNRNELINQYNEVSKAYDLPLFSR